VAAPQLQPIEDAIREIRAKGPDIARLRSLLSACGFRRNRPDPPCQQVAHDPAAVLAFPDGEKPIAFFPVEGTTLDWRRDVCPRLVKCWEPGWTGITGATGRAFLVTGASLTAYVMPVPPDPDKPIQESGVLRFDEARKWSRDLLLLTSDTIHAASYWDFLSTPTAELRERVDDSLVARLDEWSDDLAKALAQRDPDFGAERADSLIRRILDQLIFVRFCEDRRVTDLDATLFDFRGGKLRWSALRSLIRQYKRILNGDVFVPEVFEDDIVDGGLIQKILLHLYEDFTFETIPSDILGHTYERRLAKRLEWRQGNPRYVEDQRLRKRFGVYYTPEPVASYLAERALDVWRLRATKPLEKAVFLDPCAGSGTFLVQGLRALINALRELRQTDRLGVPIDERARLLGECIFGMDLHPAPLDRSALACYFEARSGQSVTAGQRLLPRLLGRNLVQGNACDLAASLPMGLQADMVLLNPPYTGHSSASAPCWRILRQALDHLPENGVLGIILPDAILRNERLRELRKAILHLAAIEEFGLVRTEVFAEPNIRPIFLLLRRVGVADQRMAQRPTSVFIRSITPEVRTEVVERSATQASLVRPPLYSFLVHVPDTVSDLQTRLLDSGHFRPLRESLRECSCGMMNAPAEARVHRSKVSCDMPSAMKAYLQGKDLQLFQAHWKGWFVDYEKACEAAKPKRSPVRVREPALFEVPCKLLVRRSGSILRACLDFDARYVDDKVIVCLPRPTSCTKEALHFLLGYLNSEIGWMWFRSANPQDPAYMPSIRQRELEELWVPTHVDENEVVRIAVLSHRIAQTLASGYVGVDDERIVGMRQQLLVRLARLLELSEDDVNLIVDFLDERHSVAERPFKYPKRVPPVPFVELPDRPQARGRVGALLESLPLAPDEERDRDEWEDIINGPLPDIYEHEVDDNDLRLGRELRAFEERLARIESLLEGEADH